MTSHPYFCPSKKISTYQIAFFLRGYEDNEICTIIFRVYEIAHRFGGASEKNVSPHKFSIAKLPILCQSFANFCHSCLTGWTNFANSDYNKLYPIICQQIYT